MNILIIVPRWFVGDTINYRYMFPLGLAYISAVLKKAGFNVDCYNLNHYSGPVEPLIKKKLLGDIKYYYVLTGGISTFYNQIKSVIDAVRKADPTINIILGGGIISSEPELIFDKFKPDYAVLGEGEKTIKELLENLIEKKDISEICGIACRDRYGRFFQGKDQAPIVDIDALPYPDFESFEFNKYLNHMHPSDQFAYDLFDKPRAYPIIGSRSCPFQCTFCFHPLGKKYRQRSVDSIMAELETNVPRYRINIISIYDELFSNDRERVFKYCERIKKLIKNLKWECKWNCQMRVDKVDDELLKVMKESGCYMISYGFESYHPDVLKSMKKHINPIQIDRAVKLTMKNNISIQANFIFGDTAETLKTAKVTLDYWGKNVEAGIILSFINPYPGTEIYQRLVRREIIKDKIDFISNHIFDIFNMSEKMTDSEFGRLWFDVLKSGLIRRFYVREYQITEVGDGTVNIKLKCPHCNKIIEYKNYYILSRVYLFIMFYCRNCRRRFYLGSNIYRLLARLMLLAASVTPGFAYNLYQKTWSFLKRHDPRFKGGKFRRILRRLSDDE